MKTLLIQMVVVGDPARSQEYAEAQQKLLAEMGLDVQAYYMTSHDATPEFEIGML